MKSLNFRRTPPQSRGLDEETRRLIDQALSEGRAKTIPQGVSTADEYVWCGKRCKLVTTEPKKPAYLAKRNPVNEERIRKSKERRGQISAMMDQGMSAKQISEARGETLLAVRAQMKYIRRARRQDSE